MAWPPAQQASGADWMAPYLAQLLDDPYDAVRFGAARSMHDAARVRRFHVRLRLAAASTPSGAAPDDGHVGPGASGVLGAPNPELLMTAAGEVDIPRVLALLKQRNNRPMLLRE